MHYNCLSIKLFYLRQAAVSNVYAPNAAAVRALGAGAPASPASQPRATTATVMAYPAPRAYGFSVAARPAGPTRRPAAPVQTPAVFPPGTHDVRVEMGIKFSNAEDATEANEDAEEFALPKPMSHRPSAEDAIKAIEEAEKFALTKPLPRRPSATIDKPPGLPMPKPAVGALVRGRRWGHRSRHDAS